MKLFIDNDVAVKFAQWGLLQRLALHFIKQGNAELYMLKSLKYRFKLDHPVQATKMLGSQTAVDQLTAFVGMCKPVQGHNQAVAKALTDIQSVDIGEATLFAAAAHFDAALMDTGDKKALRALGALGDQHLVVKALAQKVACLEQTVDYFVGRWGFQVVGKAVLSAPNADAATLCCVKSNGEKNAIAALRLKVEQLRPHCAGVLVTAPFSWIA